MSVCLRVCVWQSKHATRGSCGRRSVPGTDCSAWAVAVAPLFVGSLLAGCSHAHTSARGT